MIKRRRPRNLWKCPVESEIKERKIGDNIKKISKLRIMQVHCFVVIALFASGHKTCTDESEKWLKNQRCSTGVQSRRSSIQSRR